MFPSYPRTSQTATASLRGHRNQALNVDFVVSGKPQPLGREILSLTELRALPGGSLMWHVQCQGTDTAMTVPRLPRGCEETIRPQCHEDNLSPRRPQWHRQLLWPREKDSSRRRQDGSSLGRTGWEGEGQWSFIGQVSRNAWSSALGWVMSQRGASGSGGAGRPALLML